MIDIHCIFCNAPQGVEADGDIRDYEGYTLDCVECDKTMIIEDGILKDLNEVLKKRYAEMGVKIDENKDCTKDFIEF